ncbi:TetR/AcrR family transcriptional regulator [Paracoccus seriniphilus]|uniref:Transcriptional regulator, TetR family n=1 Tax=Paracoccus seriniphilus TaxID=184748 RepID=A0A239PW12_9RHOB|nr:TetR family transcriptional regulator [Paracoccus seriniphilus]SNT73887.1 transcriptional regulator, TetR family [Paracoccus seriniphilus]
MTLSLRQKRRQETARDIQRATLELALARGLEHVTTEEIAQVAGVSTRTFFNYFNNKEAAAIGIPPGFRDEDTTALRNGKGSLAADLKRFLDRHIQLLAADMDVLRMVRQVVHANLKARLALDRILETEYDELADCLHARLGDRDIALALADHAVSCTKRAITLWEGQQDMTLAAALDRAWASHIAAAGILHSSG